MDRNNINENMQVERYLQGSLSSDEQAAFEEALLASNELLDQVESAELLQQGLKDIAKFGQKSETDSKPSWIVSLFGSPRYAMAASFLLLISLGVSSALLHQLGQTGSTEMMIATTRIVPLVSVRSASQDQSVNTLSVEESNSQIVLMLDPGYDPYDHFRATIDRIENDADPVRVVRIDGLKPGYEEMLALTLSAGVLKPGNYRVTVEGWRSDWPADHAFDQIDTVPMRVVPHAR